MSPHDKINMLKYAVTIVRSDGVLHQKELGYLKGLSKYLSIDIETLHSLLQKEELNVDIPNDERTRMEILIYLSFCIAQDGVVQREEDDTLHKIALRLGINPLLIADILDTLKSQDIKEVSPDFIITLAKKYLN